MCLSAEAVRYDPEFGRQLESTRGNAKKIIAICDPYNANRVPSSHLETLKKQIHDISSPTIDDAELKRLYEPGKNLIRRTRYNASSDTCMIAYVDCGERTNRYSNLIPLSNLESDISMGLCITISLDALCVSGLPTRDRRRILCHSVLTVKNGDAGWQ